MCKPFLGFFGILVIAFGLLSCNGSHKFEVKDFLPLSNWNEAEGGIKTIYLDYRGAVDNGFVIPSVSQVQGGQFVFRFQVKNLDGKPQRFYYKIYYQNESYKFSECKKFDNKAGSVAEPLSEENFYGSWEDVSKTFCATKEIPDDGIFHMVQDSFRIAGNPRDEQRFYGPAGHLAITREQVNEEVASIKKDTGWYNAIVKKAKKENRTNEEQVKLDAVYSISEAYYGGKQVVNNRWKRNPRVGKYSFMLVVTTEESINEKRIPSYIANIGQKRGDNYVNPYYYFLYAKDSVPGNTEVIIGLDSLKVVAKPDLGKGVYVSPLAVSKDTFDTHRFSPNCNSSLRLYNQAPFEQFFSNAPSVPLNNIPVTADVQGDEYSMSDYAKNKYEQNQLVRTFIKNSDCPCATVNSDSANHSIQITTPASPPKKFLKEDVGIISRNGFTYGKYFLKIKLPKLLNKTHLWDGLTNSVWLMFQKGGTWNTRRPEPTGYLPPGLADVDPSTPKPHAIDYSEIDFEILKTSHYWPASSYGKNAKRIPQETPADSNKIMVTYTNWDMGCRDVSHYVVGVDSIKYKGNYYNLHRWSHLYRAISGKDAESDNELFGKDYYYFEIDWEPKEIIWRIGPEKNKMRVIGYMNDSITNIPNNQMVLVITKEFHISQWWPGLPMLQEKIPFPAKDIPAELYEFTIE